MENKSDCYEALENFVKDYGTPYTIIYDGKNRLDQAQNSKPNLENTASMGIHQKGKVKKNPSRRRYSGTAQKMVSRNI